MMKRIYLIILFLIALSTLASATISERGPYWNKIDNGGGSYSLEIRNAVINYDNGTEHIPVSTRLDTTNCQASYDYCVNANLYQAHFKTNVDWGIPVNFIRDSLDITYEPSDMSYGNAYGIEAEYITNLQSVTGTANENSFNYSDVFTNTDLIYSYTPVQLKEIFVLKQLPSPPSQSTINGGDVTLDYSFTLNYHSNLDMYVNGTNVDGQNFITYEKIEFRNSSGDVVFYLPKPFAYDSNGSTTPSKYQIRKQGQNVFAYIRTPYSWLNASDRVYPVYIDPTTKVGIEEGGADSYVKSAGDADKNFGTSTTLKSGNTARIYILFNISAIPTNQKIDDTSLCLYVTTKKNQLIDANHVYVGFGESTITWNNQPCGTNFDNSANCNLTAESSVQISGSSQNTWNCWNVTKMVGKDYNAENENISIILYTTDSDINEFYSKEHSDSTLWPYLNITYSEGNTLPIVSSLSLTPLSPRTNNDLTCSFIIIDADAGDSLSANITWYKDSVVYSSTNQSVSNGTEETLLITYENTAKTEEWNCTVIPYDEKAYGSEDSKKVAILNSPPTAPDIYLTPSPPYTNNDLNVAFNQASQDNDSDTITYTYRWYKDGVYQPGITGSTASNGVTSKNEVWLVNVTANDGTADSEKDTDTVTIQNSPPSISSA
jgi:hypothetical protein